MSILSTLNKLTGKKDKTILAALNSLTGKTADDIEEAVGNLSAGGSGGPEMVGGTIVLRGSDADFIHATKLELYYAYKGVPQYTDLEIPTDIDDEGFYRIVTDIPVGCTYPAVAVNRGSDPTHELPVISLEINGDSDNPIPEPCSIPASNADIVMHCYL